MTYSPAGYASMIADGRRMEAYEQAIARAVFPGAVVVDIGTGPGVMAMLACRHGASRVYAIEPSPIIGIAREIIAANGFSDRITLIEGLSTEAQLPERADVIVSDLGGVLPFYSMHIASIVDARERLLKPDGTLIPERHVVKFALVESAKEYQPRLAGTAEEVTHFDLSALRRLLENSWGKVNIGSDCLLSNPATLISLDYARVTSPNSSGSAVLSACRDGLAHGIAAWFEATLIEGVEFSNAPGDSHLIYGQAIFPFSTPVAVAAGDSLNVKVEARLVGDTYIWRWQNSTIESRDGGAISFDQSTFLGTPLSPRSLRRRTDGFACSLSERGILEREILARMDGKRTNREIAEEVALVAGDLDHTLEAVRQIASELAADH